MGLREVIEVTRRIYQNRFAGKQTVREVSLDDTQKNWLKELRANGVVKIPGFLDSATCARLRGAMDETIARHDIQDLMSRVGEQPKKGWEVEGGYHIWTDPEGSDIRIVHAENIHAGIASFYSDPRFPAVGKAYLEAEIRVIHTMANRVTFKASNRGSGGGWHRDITYRRGFKAMVYLSDVPSSGGPFQYIPHSDSALYHIFKTRHPDQYQFTHNDVLELIGRDESRLIEATAQEGTLMLFETNLIHRGKPIEEGHTRYAMTNYHNL